MTVDDLISRSGTGIDSPLATEIQRDAERMAMRIVASPEVIAAKALVREELSRDPVAATPEGAAGLDPGIDFWAMSLALREAIGDPYRPAFDWPIDETPRRWFGHDFPGASVGGVGNPDNVYRNAFLDGARRYEVLGRRFENGPTTFSLELARQAPGEFMLAPADGKLAADLGDQVGILTHRDIVVDADGAFRITLDLDPANGRPNHIQTVPGPLALNHRDTLANWRQSPNALEIRLLDGSPDTPALDEVTLIQRTAEHLPGYVRFWTPFRRGFLGAPAHNSVSAVFPRDGGWGFAAGGRFRLEDDEALVIVTEVEGAAYTGLQISDAWMMVPNAQTNQVSLNNSQHVRDADGKVTYVIARRDPGIANWIDTAGHGEGWFMLRWQDFASSADTSRLLHGVELVKLDALERTLALGVARFNASEREAQLARRRTDYASRIGG